MTINRSVGLLSTPVRTCKVGMQMLPQEKHDKIKSSIYWEEPKQCCKHRHWDKIEEGRENENIIKIGKNRKNWQTLAKLNKYKKILFFLNPQNYFINKSRRVPAIFLQSTCNKMVIFTILSRVFPPSEKTVIFRFYRNVHDTKQV